MSRKRSFPRRQISDIDVVASQNRHSCDCIVQVPPVQATLPQAEHGNGRDSGILRAWAGPDRILDSFALTAGPSILEMHSLPPLGSTTKQPIILVDGIIRGKIGKAAGARTEY